MAMALMAANMEFHPPATLLFLVLLLRCSSALPLHPVPLPGQQLKGGGRYGGHGVVIFHPPTGLCVAGRSARAPLRLGPCEESNAWRHTSSESLLLVENTRFCLRASGEGEPVRLATHCSPSDSRWTVVSGSAGGEDSRLATRLSDGRSLCLDVGPGNGVVSRRCEVVGGGRSSGSGSSQWFRVVGGEGWLRERILPGRRVDPKVWFSWLRI